MRELRINRFTGEYEDFGERVIGVYLFPVLAARARKRASERLSEALPTESLLDELRAPQWAREVLVQRCGMFHVVFYVDERDQ